MKIERITKKIIHLHFGTQQRLASTFMRFQEHYESPEWRGKVFTVGQYLDWYSQENGGNTYTKDWGGFNIPSYVLLPFIRGSFDPLTDAEQEIVDLFRFRTDKFYIIGTSSDGDGDALDHELCHGLYYTCEEYRQSVDNCLNDFDLEDIFSFLLEKGYCGEVLQDEAHAYISASAEYLLEEGLECDLELCGRLTSIYKHHLKEQSCT